MNTNENNENQMRDHANAINPVCAYLHKEIDPPHPAPLERVENESQESGQLVGKPVNAPLQEIGTSTKPVGMEFLLQLQRDYEGLQKKSVKACLRSKSFPCTEVRKLLELEPNLDFPQLQCAFHTVLEDEAYLGPLSQTIKLQPTLWAMTRLGTAVRFLQLLLFANLEVQGSSKMIAEILKRLSARIEAGFREDGATSPQLTSRQLHRDDDDDPFNGSIRQHYHPPQVACFVLAFLLKIKTKAVELRPPIMPSLWRSIDTIAASFVPDVPSQLLNDGIGGLLDILRGFLQNTLVLLGQPEESKQAPNLQLKILNRSLLTRLESFLKIASSAKAASLDHGLLKSILSLLACFRGLPGICQPTGLQSNSALMEHIQKLAMKADKCLLAILLIECRSGDTDGVELIPKFSHLKHLCDMAASSTASLPIAMAEILDPLLLMQPAIAFGKAQLLQQVLQISLQYSQRLFVGKKQVNSVLALCEHMIFMALPMCYNVLVASCLCKFETSKSLELLANSLRSISDALYLIETTAPCMTYNADHGIVALHHLLLRWLMPRCAETAKEEPQHHPIARECVLSTIHFHVARLYCGRTNQESMPLLCLLVKALFDHRTTTGHRRMICTLVRDILASEAPNIGKAVQQLVCAEYAAKRPLPPKTRKRRRAKAGKIKEELLRSWHFFTFADVEAVSSVMELIPFSAIPNASADVERFCIGTLKASAQTGKSIKRSEVNRLLIELNLVFSAVRQNPGGDCLPRVCGGMDLPILQHQLCLWFLSLWNTEFENGKRKHIDAKRMQQLAVLGSAVVRFLTLSTEVNARKAETSVELAKSVVRMFDLCTCDNQLRALCDHSSPNDKTAPSGRLVLLIAESMHVLTKNSSLCNLDEIGHGFAKIFGRLLGARSCWSLQAHVIEFFRVFSVNVGSTHKHVLSNCIPTHAKALLAALIKSRMKGKVYKYENQKFKDRSRRESTRMTTTKLLEQCSKQLEALVCRVPLSKQTVADGFCASALQIAVGSYVVTVPTQEGREATVLFPPGKTSLSDIKYMMGAGVDNDDFQNWKSVCQVHRVATSQTGSGIAWLEPFAD